MGIDPAMLRADAPDVRALLDSARDAWPEVTLGDHEFLAHLATVLSADGPLADTLVSVNGDELFLACACLQGDAAALRLLETHYLQPLYAVLSDNADEVMQRVRIKLLSRVDHAPKIGEYRGEGSLHSWLRVVALREAMTLGRGKVREVPTDEALLAALPGDAADDPELLHLKQRYRAVFKACVEDAFAQRSARERNLLRQHVLDGLTIDQLGAIYQVHRATAARWLADARRAVFDDTRTLLQQRLQLSASEFHSLLRVVRSQLDLSLHRLLTR